MKKIAIKKKALIKVSISGSAVPPYIDNIAYSLDEIAASRNVTRRTDRNNTKRVR